MVGTHASVLVRIRRMQWHMSVIVRLRSFVGFLLLWPRVLLPSHAVPSPSD